MIFVIAVMITVLSIIGCVCIKNSAVRILLGMVASLGLIIAVFIGCFTYTTKYRVNHVDSSVSPDGQCEVVLQQIGDPEWPFGPTHARLVLNKDSKKISQYRFMVLNDGGVLNQDDWSVNWEETCVRITVTGEEQPDERITLFYDGRTDSQQLDISPGTP